MERREGREKKMSHLQVIMSLAMLFGGCCFIGHRASHSPSGDSGGYRTCLKTSTQEERKR
uniref:Lipoprotein n=1 Tax=Oryza glumipatula TaxID=40148 RepID=A0A0D9YHH5_9ORYZ